MKSDKSLVLQQYPEAGIVWLNKGMCYVSIDGGVNRSKMSTGKALSGQFKTELQAWADAARILKELSDEE